MNKRQAICRTNLTTKGPVSATMVWILWLDWVGAPGWVWGVWGTIFAFVWVAVILDMINTEPLDVLAEIKKLKGEQQ